MMANYGIKDKGSFYFVKEKMKNRYIAENVTKIQRVSMKHYINH